MANGSYHYVIYVKTETSNIWGTDTWSLKHFGERFEKKQVYDSVKPNSTVKTRTVYRGCKICYKLFWKMEKLTLREKFET